MIRDELAEAAGEPLIFLEGPEFDSAIIGLDYYTGAVVYNANEVIRVLTQHMGEEDALEYFDFNIAGARGEGFPHYVDVIGG